MAAAVRLAPRWYAERVDDPAVRPLPDPVGDGPLRGLRTAARWIRAARRSRLALVYGAAGTAPVLIWDALRKRRRIVVLELLRPQPGTGPKAIARDLIDRRLLGWALRRTAEAAQVMSAGERDRYAHRYGLPAARLVLVPWARSRGIEALAPAGSERRLDLFASGRAGTDWRTLIEAIGDREWRVGLACSEAEHHTVRELAAGCPAAVEVHCELSRAEHDRMLGDSKLYVLPLLDRDPSAGHLRLMAAFDAGVPVIASRVEGLREQLTPGAATLVPPDDPGALRDAIGRLLASPELRAELAEAASSAARSRTYRDYFGEIRELLAPEREAAPQLGR